MGKRSGLTGSNRRGVVDNIQVAMVEKVEVITNPSAKYDPDGVGGIINIVLKEEPLKVSMEVSQRWSENMKKET